MNIDVRELASIFGDGGVAKPCPFLVGKAYLIRTVTMSWLGRVVDVVGDFLVLEEAAWIADLGRFHRASTPEAFVEVEPAPSKRVYVGLGSIVDAQDWTSTMVTEAK